jgi:DNA-binding CsgD family transcriptional regulator
MTVFVAARLQITRMGIISVLNQLGFNVSIREISDPGNIDHALSRGYEPMLMITASFLSHIKPPALSVVLNKFKVKILFRDQELPGGIEDNFDAVIEPDDNENLILQKIEGHFSDWMKAHPQHETNREISQREREVLRLVALGFTNKEIAGKLFISSHTVITHRKNISAKLGIKTIAGLTVYAIIHKLVDPGKAHFED